MTKRIYLAFLTAIHALYFAGAVYLKTYWNNDSVEYFAQAENMLKHASIYAEDWDVWPHETYFYSLRPPLYGLFVLVAAYLTSNVFILLLIQSLMSIYVWIRLASTVKQVVPELDESKMYFVLLLGLLLSPVQLILCNSVFSDILFQFLLCLAFFNLVDFIWGRSVRRYAYYILFCVLALLTKPALVYYAWVNVGLAVYLWLKVKRSVSVLALSFVLPMVMGIVSLINENVTGYFHYSSSKVENLWTYNTTNFLNMKYGHDSGFVYKRYIRTLSREQPNFKRQSIYLDSACTNVLKQNLVPYTVFHAQGVVNCLIAPGREFVNGYLNRNEKPMSFIKELNVNGWSGLKNYFAAQPWPLFLLNIVITVWNILLLVFLGLFAFNRRFPIVLRIIVVLLIFYIAGISSLAIGSARYKIAIYPVLLFAMACVFRPRAGNQNTSPGAASR